MGVKTACFIEALAGFYDFSTGCALCSFWAGILERGFYEGLITAWLLFQVQILKGLCMKIWRFQKFQYFFSFLITSFKWFCCSCWLLLVAPRPADVRPHKQSFRWLLMGHSLITLKKMNCKGHKETFPFPHGLILTWYGRLLHGWSANVHGSDLPLIRWADGARWWPLTWGTVGLWVHSGKIVRESTLCEERWGQRHTWLL